MSDLLYNFLLVGVGMIISDYGLRDHNWILTYTGLGITILGVFL